MGLCSGRGEAAGGDAGRGRSEDRLQEGLVLPQESWDGGGVALGGAELNEPGGGEMGRARSMSLDQVS